MSGKLVNEHQNYEIAGVKYDYNSKVSVVDENTVAVAVDISFDKIPWVDPEMFEGEFVQDTNPNTVMIPLTPYPPPAEDATILQKLEQDTTTHIDTEGVFV